MKMYTRRISESTISVRAMLALLACIAAPTHSAWATSPTNAATGGDDNRRGRGGRGVSRAGPSQARTSHAGPKLTLIKGGQAETGAVAAATAESIRDRPDRSKGVQLTVIQDRRKQQQPHKREGHGGSGSPVDAVTRVSQKVTIQEERLPTVGASAGKGKQPTGHRSSRSAASNIVHFPSGAVIQPKVERGPLGRLRFGLSVARAVRQKLAEWRARGMATPALQRLSNGLYTVRAAGPTLGQLVRREVFAYITAYMLADRAMRTNLADRFAESIEFAEAKNKVSCKATELCASFDASGNLVLSPPPRVLVAAAAKPKRTATVRDLAARRAKRQPSAAEEGSDPFDYGLAASM